MAGSHAELVCAGAALLALFAHAVVVVVRRREALDGEPESPVVAAFGLGVCTLALIVVLLSLGEARQLGDVLLLVGTAAAIMAATIPLLPALSPRRRVKRRVSREHARLAAQAPRHAAGSLSRGQSARPAPPRTRTGRPVLPPTPLVEPLNARQPSAAERPESTASHRTAGLADPRSDDAARPKPAQGAARETHRLGLSSAWPVAADAPTVPIPRIDAGSLRQDVALATARLPQARPEPPEPPGSPGPVGPEPPVRVREASEALDRLDRVVDDITGVLHLDRRDPT